MRILTLLGTLALAAPHAVAAEAPAVDPAVRTKERAGRDAALVIGNEGYKALPQAVWAEDDARSFRGWAETTRGISARRISFAVDASEATVRKLARRASWRVRKRGTLWVFYAGHGTVDDDGRRLLLPTDSDAGNLQARGIPLDEFVSLLRKTKRADRVVVILDAGFGNMARDGLDLVPGRQPVVPAPLPTDDERVVYWAADSGLAGNQPFLPAKHGLFTWTVMGGLRGWADGELDGRKDGRVTLAEAQSYAFRVGRQLGRVVEPSRDPRSSQGTWTLAQGEHLEAGPADDLLDMLGQADVRRRMDDAERQIRADAALFWDDTLELAGSPDADGRETIQAFIDEFEASTATISWAVSVAQVQEARMLLETWDETGGLPTPWGADPGVEAPEAEVVSCDDPMELESVAMMGELGTGEQQCLEARIAAERLQTTRDKISRVLLVNAKTGGDRAEWERLMVRHLEDIDRSDPDLCFSYAIHLHKGGDLENAEEVIRWADVALENKQRWEGSVHVKRVSGLLRLRAEAGNRLWVDAESRYRKEASPENDADVRDYRGLAKSTSREWLDYARAAELPTKSAYDLCVSAAGTREFCMPPR